MSGGASTWSRWAANVSCRFVGTSLVPWLKNCPTVRLLREDRQLLVATLLLAAFALSPLLATPILPLVDMGSNVGAASLLNDAAFGGWGDAYKR